MILAQKNFPWRLCFRLPFVAIALVAMPAAADDATPHFPVPAPLARQGETPALPPLQLLGISLYQAGVELTADTPEFDCAIPLTLAAFWMPSIRMESSLPIDVTLLDHMNLISQTHGFRAGPESGGSPWEVGSVYRQEYEIPLSPVAAQFSGKAYLLLAPRPVSNVSGSAPPFQLVPIVLRPLVSDRALPEEAMQKAFGGATSAIAKYVRMGLGSEVTFETPDWPENVARIGIISSLSYRSVPQGEPVCRIIVNDGESDERIVYLDSGTTTARCDYDLFQRDQLNHERASIFMSRDSAQLNKAGRPALLHTYYGVIDLGAPITKITSLRLICETETILDLHGIVPLVE